MGKDKFKVLKSVKTSNKEFTTEDIALAHDCKYGRRPLNKFEKERARRINERIEELMDYMLNTTLY